MTDLQQLVSEMAYKAGIKDAVMEASNHPRRCKCASCLQWWLACGPEDTGHGWSFGPFTQAEYEAAGGHVPDYEDEPDMERNHERVSQADL